MRWSVRAGLVAVAVSGVVLAGCGSSDSGSEGASSEKGCTIVTLAEVQKAFPDEGINKESSTEAEGSEDACKFTGDVKAGVMGKYTGPTTVTLTVGNYEDNDYGLEQYKAVVAAPGADLQQMDGFNVAAGGGKAVAKFDDGTFAFSTVDSPELSGPGNEQTIAMLELLAGNES